MPLKKGSSPKTISHNVDELHHGPQWRRTAAAHGEKVANAQAVAVAMKKAGKSTSHK